MTLVQKWAIYWDPDSAKIAYKVNPSLPAHRTIRHFTIFLSLSLPRLSHSVFYCYVSLIPPSPRLPFCIFHFPLFKLSPLFVASHTEHRRLTRLYMLLCSPFLPDFHQKPSMCFSRMHTHTRANIVRSCLTCALVRRSDGEGGKSSEFFPAKGKPRMRKLTLTVEMCNVVLCLVKLRCYY